MARRRSSNGRRMGSSSRRRLFWARFDGQQTFTTGNDGLVVNLLADFETAYGADLFGFTITRIVGNFTHASNAGTAAAGYTLGVGLRIEDEQSVSNTNTDAEQIALAPQNDQFSDWMFARVMHGAVTGATDYALALQESRYEIDLRSQRRLDELGQSLYLMAAASREPLTSDVDFNYSLNILCKRP